MITCISIIFFGSIKIGRVMAFLEPFLSPLTVGPICPQIFAKKFPLWICYRPTCLTDSTILFTYTPTRLLYFLDKMDTILLQRLLHPLPSILCDSKLKMVTPSYLPPPFDTSCWQIYIRQPGIAGHGSKRGWNFNKHWLTLISVHLIAFSKTESFSIASLHLAMTNT